MSFHPSTRLPTSPKRYAETSIKFRCAAGTAPAASAHKDIRVVPVTSPICMQKSFISRVLKARNTHQCGMIVKIFTQNFILLLYYYTLLVDT